VCLAALKEPNIAHQVNKSSVLITLTYSLPYAQLIGLYSQAYKFFPNSSAFLKKFIFNALLIYAYILYLSLLSEIFLQYLYCIFYLIIIYAMHIVFPSCSTPVI
jgi:hypothetical protein